jgi:hypothetical protein
VNKGSLLPSTLCGYKPLCHPPLTESLFSVIVNVTYAHPLEALRERQTRREAGAQSYGPL